MMKYICVTSNKRHTRSLCNAKTAEWSLCAINRKRGLVIRSLYLVAYLGCAFDIKFWKTYQLFPYDTSAEENPLLPYSLQTYQVDNDLQLHWSTKLFATCSVPYHQPNSLWRHIASAKMVIICLRECLFACSPPNSLSLCRPIVNWPPEEHIPA